MMIAAAAPRTLGCDEGARLRFGEETKAKGGCHGRRLLDEHPAHELSFWCDFSRAAGSQFRPTPFKEDYRAP